MKQDSTFSKAKSFLAKLAECGKHIETIQVSSHFSDGIAVRQQQKSAQLIIAEMAIAIMDIVKNPFSLSPYSDYQPSFIGVLICNIRNPSLYTFKLTSTSRRHGVGVNEICVCEDTAKVEKFYGIETRSNVCNISYDTSQKCPHTCCMGLLMATQRGLRV